MQMRIQVDDAQQNGHMHFVSCSHRVWNEQSCSHVKPTKALSSPSIVADAGDLLLHLLLPLPSFSSHIFLGALLHIDPPHAPHTHPNSVTTPPHHPSHIFCTIIQAASVEDNKISSTATYWLHYIIKVLCEMLEVS